MSEKNSLTKCEEKFDIVKQEEENNLLNDVAIEMKKKYDLVNEIIEKLYNDTRTDDVVDVDDNPIGQRTQLHPQLLSWIREARLFQNDLWKLTGGEIQQEGQKKSIEVMAKIVLEGVSQNPEILKKRFEEWAKSRSFKKNGSGS